MAAPNALQSTVKLYQSVVEDVVANVKEAFLDEGVDEAVLQELKLFWEGKILATKVIESFDPAHYNTVKTNSTNVSSHSKETSQHASTSHQSACGSATAVQSNAKTKSQNQQQQLNQSAHAAFAQQNDRVLEYNPMSAVRAVPLVQQNPGSNIFTPGGALTPASLGAFVRGLPHSVIQNNMFMRMPSVVSSYNQNAQMANSHISNLLPPPLTSHVMLSQQRQLHLQQQSLQQQQQQQHQLDQRFDKMPHSSAAHIAPGSNVIVLPPHLQQLTNRIHFNSIPPNVDVASFIAANTSTSATALNNNANDGRPVDGRAVQSQRQKVVIQLDGPGGISDDDDEEDFVEEDEEEDVNVEDEPEEQNSAHADEGDALNSEDDEVSNENADEMFEADDVIVCQFEKVSRIRNKWKFVLKDGIINLGRKDYVFNKAVGEAEF